MNFPRSMRYVRLLEGEVSSMEPENDGLEKVNASTKYGYLGYLCQISGGCSCFMLFLCSIFCQKM